MFFIGLVVGFAAGYGATHPTVGAYVSRFYQGLLKFYRDWRQESR